MWRERDWYSTLHLRCVAQKKEKFLAAVCFFSVAAGVSYSHPDHPPPCCLLACLLNATPFASWTHRIVARNFILTLELNRTLRASSAESTREGSIVSPKRLTLLTNLN